MRSEPESLRSAAAAAGVHGACTVMMTAAFECKSARRSKSYLVASQTPRGLGLRGSARASLQAKHRGASIDARKATRPVLAVAAEFAVGEGGSAAGGSAVGVAPAFVLSRPGVSIKLNARVKTSALTGKGNAQGDEGVHIQTQDGAAAVTSTGCFGCACC